MKVVYFGTPAFSSDVLAYLLSHDIEIAAIVTKPDKPRGRSNKPLFSAVKEYAVENYPHIPLFHPKKASTQAFVEELSQFDADLFVVVAYGEIISQSLLNLPRLGCINLHTSLLPKYRGAAPIQYALLDGAQETGVTVIEMTSKMDAGDVLAQKAIPIPEEMNFHELETELCKVGCATLLNVISQYQKGTVKKTPQNTQEATYVQKIDSGRAQIDWNQPAHVVHNQVRAFSPRPGAWCHVEIGGKSKRLKILCSKVEKGEGKAGETLVYSSSGWHIACQQKALALLEVQLEGKKRLSIQEFQRGNPYPIKIKI